MSDDYVDDEDYFPAELLQLARSFSTEDYPFRKLYLSYLPTKVIEDDECNTILDILNYDCLAHILSYIHIKDVIATERVSKAWQALVNEYLKGCRTLKLSSSEALDWANPAVLEKLLQRIGPSLRLLHMGTSDNSLEDCVARIVGKSCRNLEEIVFKDLRATNWKPFERRCKKLKSITFELCTQLTDSHLVRLLKKNLWVEQLTISKNKQVTGLFLTKTNLSTLKSLSLYKLFNLEDVTVLAAGMDNLPNLTTLKLDKLHYTLWKVILPILNKFPKLEKLSLNEYHGNKRCFVPQGTSDLCKSLANLKELKYLSVARNAYISDDVLIQVAQSCQKLEYLNVFKCNPRRTMGVTDVGIAAVCSGCPLLRHLDVSNLSQLTNKGVAAAARCSQLSVLVARENRTLSANPFAQCVVSCHKLTEVDVWGCDGVSKDLVCRSVTALKDKPRPLKLWIAGTAAVAQEADFPAHPLLTVNITGDPYLLYPTRMPERYYYYYDWSSDSEDSS